MGFSQRGSIYDGYEAYAAARCGDETALWMRASTTQQASPEFAENAYHQRLADHADALDSKYALTPFLVREQVKQHLVEKAIQDMPPNGPQSAARMHFKPRNAWVAP